ncbi:MAG TPA: flagellar hook-length control protein FliK [Alphaproteobacteria bacterium]|nr:flagellar hook-length control protein FliK [Alphaproteobacteria bacterium]HNS44092.1 flagellar hook-length control protein FliK [Alphaproteobacteria bacterium]
MTSPSVSMVAPATSSPLSMLGGLGSANPNSKAAAGQFFGFLQFLQNSNAADLTGEQMSPAMQGGMHARFQVLSANDAEFQNFLSQLGETTGLPQNVLLALTTGVPSEFLPEGTETNGMASLTLDQLSELVSSHSDALANGNILLVAANVAPEDMEQVAQSLSAALDKFQKLQNLPNVDAGTNADATDDSADGSASQPVQLVLVTLVPASSEESVSADSVSDDADAPGIPTDDTSPDANAVNWLAFANIISDIYRPKDAASSSTSTDDALAVGAATSGTDAEGDASPFAGKPLSTAEMAALKSEGNISADADLLQAYTPKAHAEKVASFEGALKLDASNPDSAAVRFLGQNKDWANGANKLAFDPASWSLPATSSPSAQNALANPVLTNSSAAAAHPVAQAVTAMIEKTVQNGEVKTQTLSVELDPPELGRVQIHLSYEKGEPMKVRLLTEKEDTLTILRRDSHALRQALENAGVQMDGSSLNFDMSHDSNAFGQAMAQQQDGKNGSSSSFRLAGGDVSAIGASGSDSHVIETSLGIMIDEATGQVRYNLLA